MERAFIRSMKDEAAVLVTSWSAAEARAAAERSAEAKAKAEAAAAAERAAAAAGRAAAEMAAAERAAEAAERAAWAAAEAEAVAAVAKTDETIELAAERAAERAAAIMDKRTVVIKPSHPHPAGVSVEDVVNVIVEQVGMTTLIGKHLLIASGVPAIAIEKLLREHDL